MPGGDRTGPLGRGPMTGRAAGYCAGYQIPGYYNYGFRRGLGRGGGRGLGRGFWGRGRGFWRRDYFPDLYYQSTPYFPTLSKQEEKTYLEDLIKGLEEEISDIKTRIQELSKEKKEAD